MAEETQSTTQVTEEVPMKGTIKFGFGQINNPSPVIVNWIFRIILYSCSVLTFAANMDGMMGPNSAKRISMWCALLTMASHLASKMFGLKLQSDEQ